MTPTLLPRTPTVAQTRVAAPQTPTNTVAEILVALVRVAVMAVAMITITVVAMQDPAEATEMTPMLELEVMPVVIINPVVEATEMIPMLELEVVMINPVVEATETIQMLELEVMPAVMVNLVAILAMDRAVVNLIPMIQTTNESA